MYIVDSYRVPERVLEGKDILVLRRVVIGASVSFLGLFL